MPRGSLHPQGMGFVGQMGHEDIEQAIPIDISEHHPHVGRCLAHAIVGQTARDSLFLKGAVALVDPEPVGLAVVSHEDIRPAIAIEVGTHDPQARSRKAGQAQPSR